MRAQDLHSEFLFHRPTQCLLELFANVTKVKCSTDLNTLDSVCSGDLNLELPPTVKSPISF